jgi:hypothetical protein
LFKIAEIVKPWRRTHVVKCAIDPLMPHVFWFAYCCTQKLITGLADLPSPVIFLPHVRYNQVDVSEFSSRMCDTVRWVCPNSLPACVIQSGGCVRILLPHVQHSQVGVSELSSLMFDTVRWVCPNSPPSRALHYGKILFVTTKKFQSQLNLIYWNLETIPIIIIIITDIHLKMFPHGVIKIVILHFILFSLGTSSPAKTKRQLSSTKCW